MYALYYERIAKSTAYKDVWRTGSNGAAIGAITNPCNSYAADKHITRTYINNCAMRDAHNTS
jgi:hypothetical protein